jgi:hypothetical protein
VRRVVVLCLLAAVTHAHAQPLPPPSPAPDQPPPAPAPAPPAQSEPAQPAPAPTPQPNQSPAPAPPPPTLSPPIPPPYGKKETPTQKRLDAASACAAHSPDCDWLATFSSLERQSIARAMAARGLEIDPQPWGKPIAQVLVYNENVFAEKNWLQFFNFIHFTTREKAIRDELTISAGDTWDDEKVAESGRKLHDPLYSSVVALLPVKSTEPGKVNLLVVTRDVWSLRFNTQYTYQQGSLTNLSISISENNFLGHRNVLAAAVLMDQGSIAVGPLFIDKNFLGKHLDFRARVDSIMTRQTLDVVTPDGNRIPTGDPKGLEDGGGYRREGSDATISLSRPLWSLATEWGVGSSFTYRNSIARSYFGTGIRSYDDPRTPEVETLAREFRYKTWSVTANATRQWGSKVKQQFTFGYTVSSQRPSLLPNTTMDPMLQQDFIHDVFPRNEVISQPYVEYALFTPRYKTIRNVGTYELAEDIRLGPDLDVSVAQALAPFGSTHTFTRPGIAGGWTFPLGRDGYVRPGGSMSVRIQSDGVHETIDNTASIGFGGASPTLGWVRFVAQGEIDTRWHDTQNSYYTIGSDSGLRGYPINAFIGQRRVTAQIEARTTPWALWVLRLGAVAFYETGGAASSLGELHLYHDVGLGLRMLIPQTSRELFRFDMALPLEAIPGNPVSPHFIAGFQSYF